MINAALAQGKGRPGATWFLISLLLGPFATLLIVLLPRLPVDPNLDSGGWRPRPLTRLDWIVLAIIVVAVVVTAALALPRI